MFKVIETGKSLLAYISFGNSISQFILVILNLPKNPETAIKPKRNEVIKNNKLFPVFIAATPRNIVIII